MTWQTITVAVADLTRVLADLRRQGATITHCTRDGSTCEVTSCR